MPATKPATSCGPDGDGVGRGHVLVVEDDSAVRDLLVESLEAEGYPAVGAANGREAIAHLRGTPGCVLILLDLGMPVMDGCAFRASQLEERALAAIPVIVLSADVDAERKARRLGAAAWMEKPVEIDRLVALVARHL